MLKQFISKQKEVYELLISSTLGVGPNSTYSVGNAGSATTNGHPGRSHNTEIIGNTDNSSTLQPYITTYFWKRTA